MTDKINEKIKKNKNLRNKMKNIIIIKFDINTDKNNNEKSGEYLNKIYEDYCSLYDNNGLYFIFIFDIKDKNNENFEIKI